MAEIHEKYEKLKGYIADKGRLAVAFSGGVDSAFLLAAAIDAVGRDNVLAISADTVFFPAGEKSEAVDFCKDRDIKHVTFRTDVFEDESIRRNPSYRCYICKKLIFNEVIRIAIQNGFEYVAEGSNVDDLGDYRPGLKAIDELGVLSPLVEAAFSKKDIREMSKEMGLGTWDKPSMACLASRFVYGETITEERLRMVERAEDYLRSLGLRQCRVRLHGEKEPILARIEVEEDGFEVIREKRSEINNKLKEIGFTYITADLGGFHSGSMNVGL